MVCESCTSSNNDFSLIIHHAILNTVYRVPTYNELKRKTLQRSRLIHRKNSDGLYVAISKGINATVTLPYFFNILVLYVEVAATLVSGSSEIDKF